MTNTIEKLKQLHETGMSWEKISRVCGVSLNTVRNWIAGKTIPNELYEHWVIENLKQYERKNHGKSND